MRSQTAPCLTAAALLLTLFAAGCDDGGAGTPLDGDGALPDAESRDGTAGDAAHDAGVSDLGADAGTADASPLDASLPFAPGEPGPWKVGFATEHIEYDSPMDEAPRGLDLHWWYPTTAEMGSGLARYGGVFPRNEVLLDAPVVDRPPFPVVVFSHGNGGLAEQSYFFTEFLASHGFVVVAPDHTGNTALGPRLPMYQFFDRRPVDIIALLDFLDALPAEHRFAGRLSDAWALAGHSFGGYTTLALGGGVFLSDEIEAEACPPDEDPPSDECLWLRDGAAERFAAGFGDDRLRALIPMAPAGDGLMGAGVGAIATPLLMMTAGRDATLPDAVEGDPIWANLPAGPDLRLSFGNAGHYTFSNACTLLPGIGANDGCGEDFTPLAVAFPLINAYSLAFLRLHLLGDTAAGALLDGDSLDAAVVDVLRKR